MSQPAATRHLYYWRLLATGLSFTLFGIGGLVLTLVVFPVLLLLPKATRSIRARWCIHKGFAFFIWFLERMGIMKFEVRGREHLKACGSQLILANHPTLLDVVALIALTPDASCVVKQAIWKNPCMGGVVRAAAYISNAQPEGVLDACVEDLRQSHPLIIFPEGTRTVPGQAFRFQRGAAYIALGSGKPILPVLIRCEPSTLTKGLPWYRIPPQKFILKMDVLAPIDVAPWVNAPDPLTLKARRLTCELEKFFTENLRNYEHIEYTKA